MIDYQCFVYLLFAALIARGARGSMKVRRFDMLALTDFQQASHRLLHATSRQLYMEDAEPGDQFGLALASLGDIDSDGFSEFAVASTRHKSTCIYVNVIRVTALSHPDLLSIQPLCYKSTYNNHYAALSLLCQGEHGSPKSQRVLLAVGSPHRQPSGSVQILTLNRQGKPTFSPHELNVTGIPPESQFGASLACVGDLNGDGNNDLLVGAPGDSTMYVLFLDETGRVLHFTRHRVGSDQFGRSMAMLGDINEDMVLEILVSSAHIVHLVRLSPSGELLDIIALNLPEVAMRAVSKGNTLSFVGFDDADNPTFAIGSRFDSDGGSEKGAIWVATINPKGEVLQSEKFSETQGNLDGKLEPGDHFGASVATALDVNKDGFAELLVGVPRPPSFQADNTSEHSMQRPGVLWILDVPGTKSVRTTKLDLDNPKHECVFGSSGCTCVFRQRPSSQCLAIAEVTPEGTLCHERFCSSAFECDCRGTDYCTIEHVSKIILEPVREKPALGALEVKGRLPNLIPCEESTNNATILTVHRR